MRRQVYILSVLGVFTAACTEVNPAEVVGLDPPDPLPQALAWIGTFSGNGDGVSSGATTQWTGALLRITLDPDSVRLPECPYCVSLALEDSLYAQANIDVMSEVEMSLSYTRGDTLRQLSLLRYSGGGGTGNLLDVSLTVTRPDGTIGTQADFVMERQ